MALTNEQMKTMYLNMQRGRTFELEAERLASLQKVQGFIHLSVGQEAAAAGACMALRPDDIMTGTHRSHTACICKGANIGRMMAELFGRETGYCKGRGGSLHVADVSRGILGANGIVGGGIPIATGAALGSWIRGSDEVTVCFFGEGASNEGIFHESVNMAAIWKLPVVYVVENNQWAVNTPAEAVLNTPGVAERAVGYGIPGVRIDGNDVELVYNTVGAAVERARRGEGPSIVELYTFRMRAHNSADREIRPQELRDEWEAKSPIRRARAKLLAMGVSESELEEIDAAATAEIEEAYRFASASPYPDPATVCDNVFRNDNERGTVR